MFLSELMSQISCNYPSCTSVKLQSCWHNVHTTHRNYQNSNFTSKKLCHSDIWKNYFHLFFCCINPQGNFRSHKLHTDEFIIYFIRETRIYTTVGIIISRGCCLLVGYCRLSFVCKYYTHGYGWQFYCTIEGLFFLSLSLFCSSNNGKRVSNDRDQMT